MSNPEISLDEPHFAPFFCVLGAVTAIVFSTLGAAYGTAKAAVGISSMSIKHPQLIMKAIVPVVMAGIIAIYGLVIAVLLAGSLNKHYSAYKGFLNLSAGMAVGVSGMAAGIAIGVVGEAGVRASAQQPKLFVAIILILIFAEVLGLYGLIVAIYLFTK
ncbi:V-type proton ATPase 16 kDa proteolipid subunit c [Drosophila takahashii]|uniref:V-type proton ATPase 16 kDa proteolipid subunit c n=1 Tax=Drosophila takahashii TaxID=29030 RepID=UPI001CF88A19|nr:V-type proton ATPase 16 kDa proteolipid subunit [Drosophila takahashii]